MNRKSENIALFAAAACVVALLCVRVLSAEGVRLSEGGRPLAVIATASNADQTEAYAAQELQSHLERVGGARLEIVDEAGFGGGAAVWLGDAAGAKKIIPDADLAPLGEEGFIIRTSGPDLAIRGGTPRGTMYGVYALLEGQLGVRWYTPDATVTPKRDDIAFGSLNISDKPAYEYRESFFWHAFNGDWAGRNRVNGNSHRLDAVHGGSVEYLGGFVHTFNGLVPPDKYFDEHPEYYSEIAGERKRDAQLCLTNHEALEIVKKRVLELAESAGGRRVIISVSQNDNQTHCQCEKCRMANKEKGGPAGTLVWFVNQVADAAAGYPNVSIDTLAYQYTEGAPDGVKPRDNVIIRLCHMAPSCDLHPLGMCFWNQKYVKNLEAWAKLTDRLYVWHYVTDFSHYLQPFPDLNAIVKDMAYYNDNSVKGLFAQGSYQSHGGDMAELKGWLIAKLLWNPHQDPEALLKDFIEGYYGPAAPAMKKYIYVQRKHAKSLTRHAHLFSPPNAGFLDHDLLMSMDAALDEAEKLAAGDPAIEERVARHRLALLYVQLAAPEVYFENYKPSAKYKKIQLAALGKFEKELDRFDVTKLNEWSKREDVLEKLKRRIYGWRD